SSFLISSSSVVSIIPSSIRRTFCSIAYASSMCLTSCSFSCSEAISASSLDSPHDELAELAASKRRSPLNHLAGRLELVDEAAERAAVAQRQADDVERRAGERPEARRAGRARDLLPHRDERRQHAAEALDVPDAVELAHRTRFAVTMPPRNLPFPPMEAELIEALPEPDGWQYEPKWDGFRGVLENLKGELNLWSRNAQPLLHYFPELREAGALLPPQSALDG